MDRMEQLQFLNRALLAEMPEYAPQAAQIPGEEGAQRRLLRSLMNLRPPKPLDPGFLAVQDALLSAEREARGVVDGERLPVLARDPRLAPVAGGHHPPESRRHRQRSQLRPAGLLPPLPRLH